MTRFVAFVLLLNLVAGIEALPAKHGVNRQQVVRNGQTKYLGSLLKDSRESGSLQKVSKSNSDDAATNRNRHINHLRQMAMGNDASPRNEILDLIEQEFAYTNLSRPLPDVPEAYQTAIFSTMFLALIEKYSSYCPGSALANLIAGYLRYSVYDLYEDEELNDIVTNISHVGDASMRIRERIHKHRARFLTNSERYDLAEDLVRIRQTLLNTLIFLLQKIDFLSSDMVFWQIEYDVYLSTTQGDTMKKCVEKLVYSAFNSGYLEEIGFCNADREEVLDELESKLNTVVRSLEQQSFAELYGISSDLNGNSDREKTISIFIGKLESFRISITSTILLLTHLLDTGNTADIERFLASQLTYYTERWIRLNAPVPEKEPIGESDGHESFDDILNDPRLNNFLLKSTKDMFTKLLVRFMERAKADGIQTARLLDILSSSLDYLKSDS